MAGKYSDAAIVQKLEQAAADISNLYKNSIINSLGVTTDTGRQYVEVAAQWLLEHTPVLDKIEPVMRRGSYCAGGAPAKKLTKHEDFALAVMDWQYDHIGDIFGCNIPLTDDENCTEKIDLAAGKWEPGDDVYVLGLRPFGNADTLLRCALEIYTRWRQLDREKFISDYVAGGISFVSQKQDKIIPGVLVFQRGHQHLQYISQDYPYTQELIKRLGIGVFLWGFSISKVD